MSKSFGHATALDGVTLSIGKGEFCSILGPSGCGKTTLLRLIAGLETPDAGKLFIEGSDASGVPPQRRPVNTVFQSYALFPHLSVFENVGFGLRMRRTPVEAVKLRVQAALETVQVAELRDRFPHQLSGGQKQRIALARAIVNEPKVLLLDEPLAAVDARLRRQLQAELRALQERLHITFVYVTHDQDEALVMSDTVVLMNNGRIEQIGPPRKIYEKPRTRFAASFLGGCNILEGEIHNEYVRTKIGRFRLARPRKAGAAAVAIRPERVVVLAGSDTSGENCVEGVVTECVYRGAQTETVVSIGAVSIRATISNGVASQNASSGGKILLCFPAEDLILLED